MIYGFQTILVFDKATTPRNFWGTIAKAALVCETLFHRNWELEIKKPVTTWFSSSYLY
jgi:hypothetical protein